MLMTTPTKLLFLPGASGDTSLWEVVAERVIAAIARTHAGEIAPLIDAHLSI
jgi:hypothetical protein